MKGKKVCVVCGKAKNGTKVDEGIVIEVIRKIKQRLGVSSGNVLVVCKECMPKAKQKRASFERNFMLLVGLGLILVILNIIISLSEWRFSLTGILLSLAIVAFLALISLIRYFPKVESHG